MPLLLPPHYFLLGLLLMTTLHWAIPVARWADAPWNWAGLALLLLGLTLSASAAWLFKRRGTGVKPFSPTTKLVLEGPYRWTRNPMYLGLVLALLGVATLLGSASPLAVVPLFAMVIQGRFIVREEKLLEAAYGRDYLRYKQRVRRWL